MDARMIAVINRLEEHISNLEKAMAHTRGLLKELAKEARKNGTAQTQSLASQPRTFLANQQPCRDGTYPRRDWRFYRENDDTD